MADFCNKCAWDMWGDERPADIDVPKIFRELEDRYVKSCTCEGCGMISVAKEGNRLLIMYFDEEVWVEENLDEYIIPKNKRYQLCQKLEK